MSAAPEALVGYVLHMRPYRESAALCELFTRERGRISVVAHGTRGRKGAPSLLAFNLLAVQVAGRGELKNLRKAETLGHRWLEGTALAAGLHLNELLIRLLPREDPHDILFTTYADTLAALEGAGLARALRRFERTLLDELGYGVPLDLDHLGEPIEPLRQYRLEPAQGFVPDPSGAFAGSMLLAILADSRVDHPAGAGAGAGAGVEAEAEADRGADGGPAVAQVARRLFNALLAPHLEGRPLLSRTLLTAARHGAAALAGRAVAAGHAPVEGPDGAPARE